MWKLWNEKNSQKTLILAFEANNRAASLNCTLFSDFSPTNCAKTSQIHTYWLYIYFGSNTKSENRISPTQQQQPAASSMHKMSKLDFAKGEHFKNWIFFLKMRPVCKPATNSERQCTIVQYSLSFSKKKFTGHSQQISGIACLVQLH